MKFKRILGFVLATLMVMSSFTFGGFAATQSVQPTKETTIVYGSATIDGTLTGTEWDNAVKVDFPYDRNNANLSSGILAVPAVYEEGKAPYAMAMWDSQYLYAYFRVYDNSIITEGGALHTMDSVELYVDELNEKCENRNDATRFYQITIKSDGSEHSATDSSYTADDYAANVNAAEGYYEVEMKYAWAVLNPANNEVIGIDFAINNTNEADSARDNSYSWNDQTNLTYKAPVYAGIGVLTGGPDVAVTKYDVVYDANGGEGAPANQKKTENIDLTLSTVVPTRSAFDFKGWSTTKDGEVEYAPGATYTANAGVTLYAVWELNFDTSNRDLPAGAVEKAQGWVKNGDLEDTSIKWQIYELGGEQVLLFTYWPDDATKIPSSTVYTYNSDKQSVGYNQFGTQYWAGDYRHTVNKVIFGDGITKLQGGVLGGMSQIAVCEIPDTLDTIDGVAFEGCSKLSSLYVAGNEPVEGFADLSHIVSMANYAFDACAGITSVALNPDFTKAIGIELFKATSLASIELPAGTTSVDERAFSNVSTLKKVIVNGTETTINRYAFANKADGTGTDYIGQITIVAPEGSAAHQFCIDNAATGIKFEVLGGPVLPPEEYDVVYDANGGEGAPDAQIKIEDIDLTLSSEVPTREGFEFLGWSTSADGEVQYAAGAVYNADSAVTLYAVWEAIDENVVKGNVTYSWNNKITADCLWEYNKVTKVLTIISNKTDYNESGGANGTGGWAEFNAEIEEVVIVGDNISKITSKAFMGATNLKKITLPSNIEQIDAYSLSGCTSLETICIAGSPVIEGVLDFSTVVGANKVGGSSFAGSAVFGNTATVGTGIILSDFYSDVAAEGETEAPTLKKENLPSNITTIYGATEYLKAFATENGLTFVPFGKSEGANIYWTIDENGVMTLQGKGALTGLGEEIAAYAADVKSVIIPETITEISNGALAALTALESATFNGDAPEVAEDAKIFGEQSSEFVINVAAGAAGFEGETWCGYKISVSAIKVGDVDASGKIEIDDLVLLAQAVARWEVEYNAFAADADGNGIIEIADVVLLAQFIAGWEVDLYQPPEHGDNEIEADDFVET